MHVCVCLCWHFLNPLFSISCYPRTEDFAYFCVDYQLIIIDYIRFIEKAI